MARRKLVFMNNMGSKDRVSVALVPKERPDRQLVILVLCYFSRNYAAFPYPYTHRLRVGTEEQLSKRKKFHAKQRQKY